MKYIVTGADEFIGRNIAAELKGRGHCVVPFDVNDVSPIASDVDCVFHTQTLHRGGDAAIIDVNVGGTKRLLSMLSQAGLAVNIVFISTERAGDGAAYGDSKLEAERILTQYAQKSGTGLKILRLAGEFGKWAQPNYNSVTATFCYNIANDVPIRVDKPSETLRLMYIDDIVKAAISGDDCAQVEPVYTITTEELSQAILSFKKSRACLDIPNMADEFTKKLYSTYLSYLPENAFDYPVTIHADNRGSFAELLHICGAGQISVNVCRPHVTKGEHWHNTKTEKFIVITGTGTIRLRRIDGREIIEYPVSGDDIRVVDIPPGYTHNIENTGNTDMVTIIWANEAYDPEKPDTYYQKVCEEQKSE